MTGMVIVIAMMVMMAVDKSSSPPASLKPIKMTQVNFKVWILLLYCSSAFAF